MACCLTKVTTSRQILYTVSLFSTFTCVNGLLMNLPIKTFITLNPSLQFVELHYLVKVD